MKKQFIIPIVLLSATMSIVSLSNTKTKSIPNETKIETTTKDIRPNLINAKQELIDSNVVADTDDLKRLNSFEFLDEIIIIIPDIQKLYLNNSNLSPNPSDNHDAYRVGMEIDLNVLATRKKTKDSYSTTPGDHNPFSKPFYLEYKTTDDDTSYFSWNNKDQSETLTMDKTNGEIVDEEWTYDLSKTTDILKGDYSFDSESLDIKESVRNYWDIISSFIIEGKISWSEKDDLDNSFHDEEKEWRVQNLSPNDIYLYAQRYERSAAPLDDLIDSKYLIVKDSHSMSEFNGLSLGTTITLIILSVLAIGGVGWMTILFFKPDKDTNTEVEAEEKKIKEETKTHHWLPTHKKEELEEPKKEEPKKEVKTLDKKSLTKSKPKTEVKKPVTKSETKKTPAKSTPKTPTKKIPEKPTTKKPKPKTDK